MPRYASVICTLMVLTLVFAQDKQNVAVWISERVIGSSYDGLIVNATFEAEHDKAKSKDYWQPTRDDVAAFEHGLLAFLNTQQLPTGSKVLLHLADYKRHYWGIVLNNRRVMMVSFFYKDSKVVKDGTWEKSVIGVSGGGDDFFRMKYDPQKTIYFDFWVNAPK